MKNLIFAMTLAAIHSFAFGQSVSIGDSAFVAESSSLLEMKSTNKGLLIPRMTGTNRLAISTPSEGLLIYETTPDEGFWYYDGTQWRHLLQDVSPIVQRKLTLPIAGRGAGGTRTTTVIVDNAIGEEFDLNDELLFSETMPLDYVGGDMEVYIDYVTMGAEAGKAVRWTCTYKAHDHISPISGTTGVLDSGDLTLASAQYMESDISFLIPESHVLGKEGIHFRIKRVTANGGNNPYDNPMIIHVSLVYDAIR